MRKLLVAVLMLVLMGCAKQEGPAAPLPQKRTYTVRITNHNWSQARVRVFVQGRSYTVLRAETGETTQRRIELRGAASASVGFHIFPLGSRDTWTVSPARVHEGGVIHLVVRNHLPLSYIIVQ